MPAKNHLTLEQVENLQKALQRLATYLESITGIQLSGSQVRRILEIKKYVNLWAKSSLEAKRDPEKRKSFIRS
jgi:hypothetical protein